MKARELKSREFQYFASDTFIIKLSKKQNKCFAGYIKDKSDHFSLVFAIGLELYLLISETKARELAPHLFK